MTILGRETSEIKDLVTVASLLVGAAWVVFNFNFSQVNKTEHLTSQIDLTGTGVRASELGNLRYVSYTYKIENESQKEISIATAVVSFFGQSVAKSKFHTFETTLRSTAMFYSSDFLVQNNSEKLVDYGISANLAGYRLSPGEAVSIHDTMYIFIDDEHALQQNLRADSIQVNLDVYSVSRCTEILLFFKKCDDFSAKLYKKQRKEDCPRYSFQRVSNNGYRCVEVGKLERLATGELQFSGISYSDGRLSHYKSIAKIPNLTKDTTD